MTSTELTGTERKDLPQLATPSDAVVESIEWVFEPAWPGKRVMARKRGGRVVITDAQGEPAAAEAESNAAEVLVQALDAGEALVDGVVTNAPVEDVPQGAFVAIDLVELDGQPLHDVPFMERRRLLESVVVEHAMVRVSPTVRLPIDSWLIAWRAAGFDRYLAKHVNSRYAPGERTKEWLLLPTAESRKPSAFGRLLWPSRGKRVPHIEDDGNPHADRDAGEGPDQP